MRQGLNLLLAQCSIVELGVVDAASPEIDADAVPFSAADGGVAAGLPRAAERLDALQYAIDVEFDLVGRRVVHAHEVIPHPRRRGARRGDADRGSAT